MNNRLLPTALCGLLASMVMPGLAAPALAQSGEEIIVTGRWGRVPEDVATLSQSISYADLDLSLASDRRELQHRVNLTARYLCDKLGEKDSMTSSPIPTCRDAASQDALKRVGTMEASFAPRGTTWVRPSRWSAPYPSTWESQYP